MSTTHSTVEAAQALGVSPSTVLMWTFQYTFYLSKAARPGHLPGRRFTDQDMIVLTYIKRLRSEGLQAKQIRLRLTERGFYIR